MKKMTNIELFNGITGKVFANLYENFPLENEFQLANFLGDFIDPEEFTSGCNVPQMTEATVKWLERAGYIWLNNPLGAEGSFTASLTPKTLKILKETPDAIEPTSCIGDKIVEFSKEQFGEGMNQLVKTAIAESLEA
jgi:hypothetical protein